MDLIKTKFGIFFILFVKLCSFLLYVAEYTVFAKNLPLLNA